jgi:hypothetical protein
MQDYKEIDRIRKNLVAVRSLAKRLLDLPRADWNDWELDFLQHMATRDLTPSPHGNARSCWSFVTTPNITPQCTVSASSL